MFPGLGLLNRVCHRPLHKSSLAFREKKMRKEKKNRDRRNLRWYHSSANSLRECPWKFFLSAVTKNGKCTSQIGKCHGIKMHFSLSVFPFSTGQRIGYTPPSQLVPPWHAIADLLVQPVSRFQLFHAILSSWPTEASRTHGGDHFDPRWDRWMLSQDFSQFMQPHACRSLGKTLDGRKLLTDLFRNERVKSCPG